jgi:hypothetical protein
VSRFLQRNPEMLAAIDAKAGEIERLLDLPDARADQALRPLDGLAASLGFVPAS